MDFLKTLEELQFLGNSGKQWVSAILMFIAILATLWIVKTIILVRLKAIASRTTTTIDDLALSVIDRTKLPLFLLFSLSTSLTSLQLEGKVLTLTKGILVFSIIVQIALWSIYIIDFYVKAAAEKADDGGRATTVSALGFLAKIFVWVFVLLLLLDNYGVNIAALVTGLGIGGVAVALAVQNVLGDLLASLSIVLDKPFVIGDFIQVGSQLGTVEHIGLKTTRLTSATGEQLIFSNSDLLQSRIQNFRRMRERRFAFTVGILYETPTEKLDETRQIISKTIEDIEGVRLERCFLASFGPSSLDYEVVYWIHSRDYNVFVEKHHEISVELVRRFRKAGLDFAYPTRKIYVENVNPAQSNDKAITTS
ncbi:MAG: mechanosensitive ion channel family protein [Oligoflexia bacterium]|nr:mechanosensitive ion channel family protein [Oligoflexia bacterium]